MSSTVDSYPQPANLNLKNDRLPLWWRRLLTKRLQLIMDLAVLTVSFTLAYLFRFDFVIPTRYVHSALMQLPYVLFIQFGSLLLTGVYTFIWRYVGMSEVKAFLKAA